MTTRRPIFPLVLLVATAAGAVGLAACGGDAPPTPSPAELDRVWHGEGPRIEVRVHDLHCERCEASARRAVGGVPGVASVEADHGTDLVRIRLAEGVDRYATIPALRDALHGIGKDIVGEDEIPEAEPAEAP